MFKPTITVMFALNFASEASHRDPGLRALMVATARQSFFTGRTAAREENRRRERVLRRARAPSPSLQPSDDEDRDSVNSHDD
jgi:hypothetical protein